ncbi:MAG: sigma 54-interacting transcriptional regulator [Gammaproteobacteria bacterium]|nr:sigma 54-interacting transcriptional regulator [Gammaproteobacteria bacterium]
MTTEGARILVVDDDADLLRLLSIRLQSVGYQVTIAESAEQALASLEVARPQVVITDLRMDGMDGLALFDAVHGKNPALPVIILTAHGSIPEAVAATSSGVFSFLTKPFDSRVLLAHVAKALELSGYGGMGVEGAADNAWRRAIITRSPLVEDLLTQARMVADSDASVCIYGDSGTGKELLARAIHGASPRRSMPFVAVNCSAIPDTLLESELFGHAKGAFTGATRDHQGLFKAAHRGTLLLDEIGDMPLALQAKLLRVLQERQVRPVGSTETIPVDVRVISATHRDLRKEMAECNFREDLYYRLNVVSLEIPPLAARREDIPLLAAHFLKTLSEKYKKKAHSFSPEAIETLVAAPWPGNVRQLLNVVEQCVALSATPVISAPLVQKALREDPTELPSFVDARNQFEREYLARLLKITSGNVSQAARLARRNRTEFYRLLHRHRLDPAEFKPAR